MVQIFNSSRRNSFPAHTHFLLSNGLILFSIKIIRLFSVFDRFQEKAGIENRVFYLEPGYLRTKSDGQHGSATATPMLDLIDLCRIIALMKRRIQSLDHGSKVQKY